MTLLQEFYYERILQNRLGNFTGILHPLGCDASFLHRFYGAQHSVILSLPPPDIVTYTVLSLISAPGAFEIRIEYLALFNAVLLSFH